MRIKPLFHWLYRQIIILIVVSLFFVPNSAFATIIGPFDFVLPLLALISIVVVPIAIVYLGIVSLKHFKPNLWNYTLSNRFTVIGAYLLAEGISWTFYRAIYSLQSISGLRFGDVWIDYGILAVFPGILFILIGGTRIIKHYNNNKKPENS